MKRPALLLAVALLVLSFALISYRILWLKYPILPAAPERVWQLSMDASIQGWRKGNDCVDRTSLYAERATGR